MIIQATPDKTGEPPMYELIKAITSASSDPIFKHKRFLSALDDYRLNGLYTRPKPPPTDEQLKIYADRRKKQLADLVWEKRFIVSVLNN